MGNSLPSSLTRNNRNSMMYADAISSVWAWWDLIADPSYALREDLDIWEVAQRDPKVHQAIQFRLNSIAGREWRVMPRNNSKKPAAKIKAALVDAMLRRIPHFQDARRRLAQAVFRGQASELITGRREFISLADKPSMHWWVCTGLKHVDPRRFVIRPVRERRENGTMKVRGQLYMSVIPTYQSVPTQKTQPRNSAPKSPNAMRGQFDKVDPKNEGLWYGRYVPVEHPEWLVRIIYDDEEARLGFGRGLLDAVYFFIWIKQIVIREGLQGLERFVHGVPIVTLDPSKRGATDQTSEAVRDAALASLKKMRAGHAIVINAGETIQWAEPGSSGQQMVTGWLEYLDRCLMGAITGAALKSGGDQTSAGSYASDQVGADMQDTVVQYDRDKIDEDLTTDLIGLHCKLNREQFRRLEDVLKTPGIADEPDPVFTTVVKKRLDPLSELQIVQGAAQVKDLDLPKDEVYERLGYSVPEDEEEVFKGGSAIPPEPPQIDPATGLPLPPGMPEPGEEEETDEDLFPDGAPEDNEEMFGAGEPEEDESLFEEAAELEAEAEGAAVQIDPEAVPDEEMYPEREMVGDGEGLGEDAVPDAEPIPPVKPDEEKS